MKCIIEAIYACGHAPRIVASGHVNPKKVSRDVRLLTEKATGDDGKVHFNCRVCKRGCAKVVMKLDGKIIGQKVSKDFIEMGADVSVAPDPENN